MGAGAASAGAAGPAGDFFDVLFPTLPEEFKGLPLAELQEVLLTYAAAKKKGGPP